MIKEINNELEKIYKDIQIKIKNDNYKISNHCYYFLSERDIQAYLYFKLKQKFKKKYKINLDPTITNKKKKKWKGKAKGIPPFDLYDIIINKKENLHFSEEERIEPKDKSKCFAIEIKFIKSSVKGYTFGKEDVKRMIEKLEGYPNSRIIIVDCGGKNRKNTYQEIPKEKFVLITPFDIFPAGKFDKDKYSKKFKN